MYDYQQLHFCRPSKKKKREGGISSLAVSPYANLIQPLCLLLPFAFPTVSVTIEAYLIAIPLSQFLLLLLLYYP
jgi:hypothetical protein